MVAKISILNLTGLLKSVTTCLTLTSKTHYPRKEGYNYHG